MSCNLLSLNYGDSGTIINIQILQNYENKRHLDMKTSNECVYVKMPPQWVFYLIEVEIHNHIYIDKAFIY